MRFFPSGREKLKWTGKGRSLSKERKYLLWMLVISWRTHWRHGIDQLHDDVPATWLTNGSAYNLLRLFRFITGKMNYFRRCYLLHCLNKHTSTSFDHFITQLREHYFSLRFGGLHTLCVFRDFAMTSGWREGFRWEQTTVWTNIAKRSLFSKSSYSCETNHVFFSICF